MPIFSLEGRVYWSETDAARLVHFSNILRYCERAEEEFMISLVGRGWRPGSPLFPRVHVECDYYSTLAPHERWRVDIVDVIVGRKSIEYRFEVYNLENNSLAAKCSIVAVAFDPGKARAVEVPRELREALLKAGARPKQEASREE
jgi:acyl-CoA thioester hydrolase